MKGKLLAFDEKNEKNGEVMKEVVSIEILRDTN
jgi:hypothetical protein